MLYACCMLVAPRPACDLAAWVGCAQGRGARAQARPQRREALSSDDEAPVPRRGAAAGRRTGARRGSVRASRCVPPRAPVTPPGSPVSGAARSASCPPAWWRLQGSASAGPAQRPHRMSCSRRDVRTPLLRHAPRWRRPESGRGPAAAAPRARTSRAARGTGAPRARAARARAAPRSSRRRRPTSATARWAAQATQSTKLLSTNCQCSRCFGFNGLTRL
jgi:hypothetical protein